MSPPYQRKRTSSLPTFKCPTTILYQRLAIPPNQKTPIYFIFYSNRVFSPSRINNVPLVVLKQFLLYPCGTIHYGFHFPTKISPEAYALVAIFRSNGKLTET